MKLLSASVALISLVPAGIWAQAQQQQPKRQSMQEAIAFERNKDAAAARQARIEKRHPSVTNSNADRTADRQQDEGRPVKDEKAPGAKPDKK